jgi:hypothetical protein
LRTKLERLRSFVSEFVAPHSVHVSGAGSLTFCSTSMTLPQL